MSEASLNITPSPVKSSRQSLRYKKERNVKIALEYANTPKSIYDIAEDYGVRGQTISAIIVVVIKRRDISDKIIEKIEKKRRGDLHV